MRDIPFHQMPYKDFTIQGYSRAAVQTFWRIPEFHLGFDLGVQPWSFMGTERWFLSHAHLDHMTMLPNYIARRRMMKMTPPQIFLPAKNVRAVEAMLNAWSMLDRSEFPCELIGMEPGESVRISRELSVEAFPTFHRIPSLGYVVSHHKKKLLPELLSLTGEEIRQRKEAGLPIDHEIVTPLLAYLGDSNAMGLDRNPIFYQTEVLIREVTFVEDAHWNMDDRHGHMHLNDVVQRQEKFQNQLIIASHFTTRSSSKTIQHCVEEKLPDMLGGRLKLWL